jgi:hypothetical protein
MNIKRTLLAGALALASAVSVAGVASAETPWQSHHPRQEEVLGRVQHQRHLVRQEYREGQLSRWREHRLLRRVNRIAREDHRFARVNSGYITPGEKHFMNRQENHVRGDIPG